MTEIRPIHKDEADDFLTQLCACFDLDVGRARNVFFREPMFDPARKWALFRAGRIDSILTTVPLIFGWGNAIGIAGVATRPEYQRQGLATELLKEVLRTSEQASEGPALLFAKRPEVYERVGFKQIDEVIRAPMRSSGENDDVEVLDFESVETHYHSWSRAHPDRLRRDERRWNYWKWNLRICTPFEEGYICVEGGFVRECIAAQRPECWPVPAGTEWLGLRSMARQLGAPIRDPQLELYLMGYKFASVPQMFMTDQF